MSLLFNFIFFYRITLINSSDILRPYNLITFFCYIYGGIVRLFKRKIAGFGGNQSPQKSYSRNPLILGTSKTGFPFYLRIVSRNPMRI